MKITVQGSELKTVLSLVKAIGDCSTAKVAAHSVCAVTVDPPENIVSVGFSFNGAFLTYRFQEAMIEGGKEKTKRAFDLASLSSLKFPDKLVTLTIDDDKVIGFASGRLKGKLVLTNGDLDDEDHWPSEDMVGLTHTFQLKEFLAGLGCHGYGASHNPTEAAKRPVRIYTDESRLKFVSRDNLVTAYFDFECSQTNSEVFDFRLLPKPLKTVLSNLPEEVSPTFLIGMSKEFWHVRQGTVDVWFPNIVKTPPVRIEDLIADTEAKASCRFTLPLFALESALKEAQPFISDASLSSKEDSPVLKFSVSEDKVAFKIETVKAKDVEILLDGKTTIGHGQPKTEEIGFNFKFLSEFVAAFKSLTTKKEEPSVTVQWWKYQDAESPLKGKAVMLMMGRHRFFIVRVKPRNGY